MHSNDKYLVIIILNLLLYRIVVLHMPSFAQTLPLLRGKRQVSCTYIAHNNYYNYVMCIITVVIIIIL